MDNNLRRISLPNHSLPSSNGLDLCVCFKPVLRLTFLFLNGTLLFNLLCPQFEVNKLRKNLRKEVKNNGPAPIYFNDAMFQSIL